MGLVEEEDRRLRGDKKEATDVEPQQHDHLSPIDWATSDGGLVTGSSLPSQFHPPPLLVVGATDFWCGLPRWLESSNRDQFWKAGASDSFGSRWSKVVHWLVKVEGYV